LSGGHLQGTRPGQARGFALTTRQRAQRTEQHDREKRSHGRAPLAIVARNVSMSLPLRICLPCDSLSEEKELPMKLYYMTGACSLASNIALREAGLPFELVKVDRSKKTPDGQDFNAINPKGYVPTLGLDDGQVLTENVTVLQYIADRNPAAKLAPPAGTMERYRLMEWLSFINSEVHKNFAPLFKPETPEEARQITLKNLTARLDYLERALGSKTFLMGEQFTVADAYLYTVLTWTAHVKLDLAKWPQLKRYVERVAARPHVHEARKTEGLVK
jgi:glutathione S-transferase